MCCTRKTKDVSEMCYSRLSMMTTPTMIRLLSPPRGCRAPTLSSHRLGFLAKCSTALKKCPTLGCKGVVSSYICVIRKTVDIRSICRRCATSEERPKASHGLRSNLQHPLVIHPRSSRPSANSEVAKLDRLEAPKWCS